MTSCTPTRQGAHLDAQQAQNISVKDAGKNAASICVGRLGFTPDESAGIRPLGLQQLSLCLCCLAACGPLIQICDILRPERQRCFMCMHSIQLAGC